MGYEYGRGTFSGYAAMIIRSRIIDYKRKEKRHKDNISLYTETGENEKTIMDELRDTRNQFEEVDNLEATKQEIEEGSKVPYETFLDEVVQRFVIV